MSAKPTTTSGEPVDPDDAPKLTREWFDQADVKVAGKVVSCGGRSGRKDVGARL